MDNDWNLERIEQLIRDKVQENTSLEYKASAALGRSDNIKREITKDVSAMANSAGGVIIYGIKECQEGDNKSLPESIDAVDQLEFTKEWLQQVINNIQPKINDILITPVNIDSQVNHVVYIINIPQSNTAHQASDFKYYKRYNTIVTAMEDYEIRDIMGRSKAPIIDLEFFIEKRERTISNGYDFRNPRSVVEYFIIPRAKNNGLIYAMYVNSFISIPALILPEDTQIRKGVYEDIENNKCEFYRENTIRDVLSTNFISPGNVSYKYGPSRYDPILPGLSLSLDEIKLCNDYEKIDISKLNIEWCVHADNAVKRKGNISLTEITIKE